MKILKRILWVLIAIIVIIQFIPVERSNPPATEKIKWDSQKTYALAKRACYDCHSNETNWKWYTYVAPVSWMIADDVKEGRREINFSTGNYREIHECEEQISEGEMPLPKYIYLHPEAKLTEQEKNDLITGIKRTFSSQIEQNLEKRRERR